MYISFLILVLFFPAALGAGCQFEGKTYSQGEKWSKACQYNCVCDDASIGHYTCTDICPTYDNVPAGCTMVKPPGEPCCAKPQCSFPTVASGSSGGSVIIGSCTDNIANCADYGRDICAKQEYAQWVVDKCPAFCGKCGTGSGFMTGSGSGVITGSGSGSMTGSGSGSMGSCHDVLNNCAAYGSSACTGNYVQWAHDNCAKTCNLCGMTIYQSGSGSGTNTGSQTGSGSGTIVGPGMQTGSGSMTGSGSQTGNGGYIVPPLNTGSQTGSGSGTITGSQTGNGGYIVPPLGNGQGSGSGTITGSGSQTGTGGYIVPPLGNGQGSGSGTITGSGSGVITGGGSGSNTGSGACAGNQIGNCASYGMAVCTDSQYAQWVQSNCCLYCQSGGTITTIITGGQMTGSGSGQITESGSGQMTGSGSGQITGSGSGQMTGSGSGQLTGMCAGNTINNCDAYGLGICTNPEYTQWVHDKCCQYCSSGGSITTFITGSNTMTGSGSGSQTGSGSITGGGSMTGSQTGVITGSGTGSQTGSGSISGSGVCSGDKLNNCKSYGPSVCTDSQYASWVAENCCMYCFSQVQGSVIGNGNGVISGSGSGSITGSGSGCVYKGQSYTQGQTWEDGCDFTCSCTDASSGSYSCRDRCPTLQLPSSCTLMPVAPGQCCPQPSCPANVDMSFLPSGYNN